jgi:hypothetical protein
MYKTTIVSAFVSNINQRQDITLCDYWKFGKLLLESTSPKIIFFDEWMFQYARDNYINTDGWEWDTTTGKNGNTHI